MDINTLSAVQGADVLTAPVFILPAITAALSATVGAYAVAFRTHYSARIEWTNNGASGSANLFVAVNARNDVAGLIQSQSSKRQDAVIPMGGYMILRSKTPIRKLDFSSDTSITSGTHIITVLFGS